MTYKNSGRKRYLLWNLRDALEILNGQKEFQGEVWWTTDFHKDFSIYFWTGHSWYILPLAKAIRKEKKGHPTTPHDLDEKYSYNSRNANCISNRCRECSPTKILSGWDEASLQKAIQKDHQAVMRNPTKLLIYNGLERMEKWKKLLNLWLKKHFIESGKKL